MVLSVSLCHKHVILYSVSLSFAPRGIPGSFRWSWELCPGTPSTFVSDLSSAVSSRDPSSPEMTSRGANVCVCVTFVGGLRVLFRPAGPCFAYMRLKAQYGDLQSHSRVKEYCVSQPSEMYFEAAEKLNRK